MRGGRRGLGAIGPPVVGFAGLLAAGTTLAQDAVNVRLHGFEGLAVKSAVQGAARRLADPICLQILEQFKDAEGHTLQSNLEARGLSAGAYVLRLNFHDGQIHPRCGRSGINAVTWPGSPIVYVCGPAFLTTQRHNHFLAENYVIHEMLHTLGLNESPVDPSAPSSREITDRVNAACRPPRR